MCKFSKMECCCRYGSETLRPLSSPGPGKHALKPEQHFFTTDDGQTLTLSRFKGGNEGDCLTPDCSVGIVGRDLWKISQQVPVHLVSHTTKEKQKMSLQRTLQKCHRVQIHKRALNSNFCGALAHEAQCDALTANVTPQHLRAMLYQMHHHF